MNLKIQENVPLAELTTFKIGGNARYFAEINSINELVEAFEWVKDKGHDYFILGGGSNTIFSDEDYLGLIIKMNIMGFEVIDEDESSSTIKVGAGEDWDETVERTVNMNLSGMEALSGVPGNTGATPVQNIGAYGQEVKDTIEFVEAYDAEQSKITKLSNEDCNFNKKENKIKINQKGTKKNFFFSFKQKKKKTRNTQ